MWAKRLVYTDSRYIFTRIEELKVKIKYVKILTVSKGIQAPPRITPKITKNLSSLMQYSSK